MSVKTTFGIVILFGADHLAIRQYIFQGISAAYSSRSGVKEKIRKKTLYNAPVGCIIFVR